MPQARIVFEQPALPAFRLATYRGIAMHPGLDFKLVHGVVPGLPNVDPVGFSSEVRRQRSASFWGEQLIWQSAQVRLASREHADVLLLTWNSRFLSLLPALIRAKWNGVPTILFGHGYSRSRGDRFAGVRRAIARLSTCVLVYSKSAGDELIRSGFDPARIFVALNSIDQGAVKRATACWQEAPEKLEGWKVANGLADGPFILFVSRLTPKARLDLLVEGFAAAVRKRPDLKLVVIGSGDESQLKDPAVRLGVWDRIKMVPATYDEQALAPYFLTAKLLLYPAAIGLTIIHAFSYGLPVVTNDDIPNHNPEIEAMNNGVNGMLYKSGNVQSMADMVLLVVNNESLRTSMSLAARTTAFEQFSLEVCIRGYIKAIEHCLATRRV